MAMADSDAPPGFPQLPAGGDEHIERSRSASAHRPAGDPNIDMFPDDPQELKEARKQYRDHECRECGELGHIRFLCPKMKCFKCGRKGHARQFCPKVKKGPQDEGSTKPLPTASSGASTVVIRDASGNLRIVKEDPSQPATPPSDAPAIFQSAKPRPPPASSKAPASAGVNAAASSAPSSSAHGQNGHPGSHPKDLPPPFTVSEGTTDAGSPVGRGGLAAEASSRYVPASQPAGSVHMAGPSSSGGHADLFKPVPPHQRSSAEAPEVASTLAACSVQLQNLMRMLLQYGPNMSQVDDVRRLLDSHQQAQVSKGDAAFLNGLKDALVHESGLAHISTQQYWEAVQVAFESNLRALQTRQHGEEQHHIAAHAEMQQRPIMAPPSSYPAGPGSGLEQYSQSSSDAHPTNSLPPGSGLGTQAFIPLPNGSLASSGKLR